MFTLKFYRPKSHLIIAAQKVIVQDTWNSAGKVRWCEITAVKTSRKDDFEIFYIGTLPESGKEEEWWESWAILNSEGKVIEHYLPA